MADAVAAIEAEVAVHPADATEVAAVPVDDVPDEAGPEGEEDAVGAAADGMVAAGADPLPVEAEATEVPVELSAVAPAPVVATATSDAAAAADAVAKGAKKPGPKKRGRPVGRAAVVAASGAGGPPSPRHQRWQQKYEMMVKFHQTHGHVRVPYNLDTPEYPRLGAWVNAQRTGYRYQQMRKNGQEPKGNQKISVEQIEKLEALGFAWSSAKDSRAWDKKYEMLKAFREEFNTARVDWKVDTERYPKLGQWVMNQRAAHRNVMAMRNGADISSSARKISQEQIAKLEELGFEWKVGRGKNQGKHRVSRPMGPMPSDAAHPQAEAAAVSAAASAAAASATATAAQAVATAAPAGAAGADDGETVVQATKVAKRGISEAEAVVAAEAAVAAQADADAARAQVMAKRVRRVGGVADYDAPI